MNGRHTYADAAAELGVSARWLGKNIARLPHLKFGEGVNGRVYFTDEHLAEIRAMHEHRPDPVPAERAATGLRPVPSRPRRTA
jgi:hypothetical protein